MTITADHHSLPKHNLEYGGVPSSVHKLWQIVHKFKFQDFKWLTEYNFSCNLQKCSDIIPSLTD